MSRFLMMDSDNKGATSQISDVPPNETAGVSDYKRGTRLKTFETNKGLRQHLAKRKVFKCDHCDKIFSLRRNLVRHINCHIPNNYCETCDETFANVNLLIQHNREKHSRLTKSQNNAHLPNQDQPFPPEDAPKIVKEHWNWIKTRYITGQNYQDSYNIRMRNTDDLANLGQNIWKIFYDHNTSFKIVISLGYILKDSTSTSGEAN